MARNRKLYGLARPARAPRTKTPQPFAAVRRHQYWSVDIRHLDMANIGMKVYCVSILENYSRAILASGIFPTQDLSAYLMILYAAIRQHGVPETLVSDSGAVFVTAKQAKAIYAALGNREARDRAGQALAKLHRIDVQDSAPDGRLALCEGDDMGGVARGA